jgi:membrane-associated protease RseP (regulator of RpoE activity)
VSRSDAPSTSGVRLNALLFVLTVVSVFYVGRVAWAPPNPLYPWYVQWLSGWTFAVPLLSILVVHEAGHYVASRIHRVPATLPYFLPLPFGLFGTLGAVIVMPARIRSAKALLDIGAAGPIAGMVVAIPMMILGLSLSPVLPLAASGYVQEGQSLLYVALKWLVLGPIPANRDVVLHPTAAAAWAGFFVTFLNLVPFSQLDGGHVAFALFGRRHDAWSKRMWILPALALVYNLLALGGPALHKTLRSGWQSVTTEEIAPVISACSGWIVPLAIVLVVIWRSGGTHPPVDDPTLDRKRRAVAWATLLLFALLFMPSLLVQY